MIGTFLKNISISKFNVEMSVFVFLLVFAPPIIPRINTIFLLALYALIMFYVNRRKVSRVFHLSKYVTNYYALFIVAVLYMGAAMIVSFNTDPINLDNYTKTAYKFLLALTALPICVFYVIYRLQSYKLDIWRLVRIVIYAGLIQAFITILMLAIPLIRTILLGIMFANNSIDIGSIPFWELDRRYYAFSDSVLDTFGFGVGIIAALPLYLFTHNKSRLIFTTPFLLLVPLFNSVTGLIVFLVGFSLIARRLFVAIRQVRQGFSIAIAGACVLLGAGLTAIAINPERFEWTQRELSAVATLGEASGDQITSFSLVFRPSFWAVPESSLGFLIGEGHTLYGAAGFDHSDIGYINNLWLGGILGSILLYGSFVYLFRKALVNVILRSQKMLLVFLAISFFIFEIKGYGIGFNPGFTTVMLLIITSICLTAKLEQARGSR